MNSSILNWLRFNLWYFQNPPWDTGISPPELQAFIQEHPPGRALDLGCGTGTNLVSLARAGWQVVGVDFALRAVNLARRRCSRAGVRAELRVGDVSRLDVLSGTFDLILDIGCYHGLALERREAYRRGLDRLLAPGGTFLIYAHQRIAGNGPVGIDASEVEAFQAGLRLGWREDSLDRRGRRAVWMRFER